MRVYLTVLDRSLVHLEHGVLVYVFVVHILISKSNKDRKDYYRNLVNIRKHWILDYMKSIRK